MHPALGRKMKERRERKMYHAKGKKREEEKRGREKEREREIRTKASYVLRRIIHHFSEASQVRSYEPPTSMAS